MIHEKMVAIMRDIGAIGKDEKNQGQGFKFRGIDTVYNELHNIMARHGVYSLPEVIGSASEDRQTKAGGNLIYRILTIRYHFFAEDGTTITCTVVGEGQDSGDKASSKAMSIAHKYALLQAFCIPTAEQKDPDYDSPPPSVPKAAPTQKEAPAVPKAAPKNGKAFDARVIGWEALMRGTNHPDVDGIIEELASRRQLMAGGMTDETEPALIGWMKKKYEEVQR